MIKFIINWFKSLYPKELALPEGKTCGDCGNFEYGCYYRFGKERDSKTCAYTPSKFDPYCHTGQHLIAECPGDHGK